MKFYVVFSVDPHYSFIHPLFLVECECLSTYCFHGLEWKEGFSIVPFLRLIYKVKVELQLSSKTSPGINKTKQTKTPTSAFI